MRQPLPKLLGLPLLLAIALGTAGCPDTEGTAQANEQQAQSPLTKAKPGPETGPAANAPKLDADIVNPQVMDYPTGKYGGGMILPANEDPKTFNPVTVEDGESQRYIAYVFDGLTDVDGMTGEVIPCLADKWTISPDGRTYTVHLRDGIKWSDGQPITADDVVFTWMDVMENPDIVCDSRDIVRINGKLPVVAKKDARTVTFSLPNAFAPFDRVGLGNPIVPKHVVAPWIAKGSNGKPLFNSKWGVDADVKTIVGSGAFMFDSYAPGERIILKRNPHYYRVNRHKQPLPYLDTLTFPFLKDPDTQLLKFKAGETDYAVVYGKDFPYMKPLEKSGNFTIYDAGPRWTEYYLTFNLNPGKNKAGQPYVDPIKLKWFGDRRFRQAVSLGIDRKNIIRNIFGGLAVEQNSPVFQLSPFYYKETPKKLAFDPQKAMQLLKEAGFHKDGDTLYDKDGHPVSFTLLTTVGFKEGEMEVDAIKDDLADLGIKVNVQAVTFNVEMSLMSDLKQWDCNFGVWGAGPEPHEVAHHWLSDGQMHLIDLNIGAKDSVHYPWEAQVDRDFKQGVITVDPAKRKQIYWDFQKVIEREQPEIYLPDLVRAVAIRNTIGNARPNYLSDLGAGWNAYELYRK